MVESPTLGGGPGLNIKKAELKNGGTCPRKSNETFTCAAPGIRDAPTIDEGGTVRTILVEAHSGWLISTAFFLDAKAEDTNETTKLSGLSPAFWTTKACSAVAGPPGTTSNDIVVAVAMGKRTP